jgi:hypothetical protein
MKKLLLLLPLTFLSVPTLPVQAQQVYYSVCKVVTKLPGYYDSYGNYYAGGTQESTIPCNQVNGGNWNQTYQQPQRVCNPTAGAAMGAGLAEALSGGNGYRYNSDYSRNGSLGNYNGSSNYSYRNYKSNGWSLFGAGLGALMYSC